MSKPVDWEEVLEPKKFDPLGIEIPKRSDDDALHRYNSIAGKNPYTSKPSYREELKDRECRVPILLSGSPKKGNKNVSFKHHEIWILPSPTTAVHPSMRDTQMSDLIPGELVPGERTDWKQKSHHASRDPNSPGRQRAMSQPFPRSMTGEEPQTPTRSSRQRMPKSFSDTHFISSHDDRLQKERAKAPKPLILSSSPPRKETLPSISEQEAFALNYKVQVRETPESEEKVIRSPLKRLFGEGGLLGRSASARDLPDPRYKKTGLAVWGGKVKQRVEDLGKEISEKFSLGDLAFQGASSSIIKTSTFPVTLSPYAQGDFYMQLELLLNIETNKFLLKEFEGNRLSITSVKSVVESWTKKGRPQVLGFRYDLLTQRELVYLNAERLRFAGINAFTKIKLLSVLAAWKVLAKEVALHTFCQPDSAVKKHLHDAEKVLELVDASADSMLAFQEMRSRVVAEIYRGEREERERREWMNGEERAVNLDGSCE